MPAPGKGPGSASGTGGPGSMGGSGQGSPGGYGGGGRSGDQRHRNRLAEIARVAAATGTSMSPVGNTGVSRAGRVSSALQGMARDFRDVGNSPVENFGNRIASLMGFNQQPPSMQAALGRVNQTPAGQVTDNRAGWGFDPAGLMGSLAGMAVGVPFGTGFLADQISSYLGRPLEIGMGPSVFGGNPFSGLGVNTAAGVPGAPTGGATGGRIGPGHTVTPPGVLAPRPTAPGSPGAPGTPGTPQPNPWGPPPPTPMPDFTNVPQWPGFNGPLAPPQNNNWGWG